MVKYEEPKIKIVSFCGNNVYCIVRVSSGTDMVDDVFDEEFNVVSGGVI
ncbi:MAG: hypothetical protein ACI4RO_05625 [Candidatus Scatosoma sp.]